MAGKSPRLSAAVSSRSTEGWSLRGLLPTFRKISRKPSTCGVARTVARSAKRVRIVLTSSAISERSAGLGPRNGARRSPGARRDALRSEEALFALESDERIVGLLGDEFVRAYGVMRRHELQRFADHVTDWELTEYLELY